MSFFLAQDTINGQEARCYATINSRVEEMFYAKKLEAKAEKQKAEIKTLGKRGTQHKAAGWKGTGSMTIYYVTSQFREIMLKYIKQGVDTYFDITVINEDPTSSIGRQTVVLKGVNLDSVPMAMFDTESDALEEEIAFTFDDIEILDSFGKPILG